MNIMIATDGSSNSLACVDALKTRPYGTDTVVHIISIYDTKDYVLPRKRLNKSQAEAAIRQTVDSLKSSGCKLHSQLLQGEAAKLIIKTVSEIKPDMLFIGAHAPSSYFSPFLSNIAQTVLENATCSVTVIKSLIGHKYGFTNKHLICADSTSGAADSWVYKLTHVWPNDGQFLLLNVIEPPINKGSENPKIDAQLFLAQTEEKRKKMFELIEAQVQYFSKLFPRGRFEGRAIISLDVIETILDTAKNQNVDLIIMSPHKRKGMDKFLSGSVSYEIARRAQCSVEIVR